MLSAVDVKQYCLKKEFAAAGFAQLLILPSYRLSHSLTVVYVGFIQRQSPINPFTVMMLFFYLLFFNNQ